ncbi:hypothetical protein [Sphingomonas lacusdianchii]|uniref:hypothetical protein n=1 Tax=Sphingomonas lacusdianchii TaxID=2917992 RepID=UPI001F55D86D|nr:hypothetical protein [Sphingomonas sp. JXJ CY 53]
MQDLQLLREVGDHEGKFVGDLLLGRASGRDRGRGKHQVRCRNRMLVHEVKGPRPEVVGQLLYGGIGPGLVGRAALSVLENADLGRRT